MIPKTIHYCWFGHNPKSKLAKKCLRSWKRNCPDYTIIEWNEDNFDISACPLYVRQAYEAKKWAFVSDYARLKIVYEHGGIYLDTDVEVVKSFDPLLENEAYFCLEYGKHVATGLGFGAARGAKVLEKLMAVYEDIPFFTADGGVDATPCPVRETAVFQQCGLKQDNSMQRIMDSMILPTEYLCPYDGRTGVLTATENTFSIHWYDGSWIPQQEREKQVRKYKDLIRRTRIDYFMHLPNRMLKGILGEESYDKLKRLVKRKR